MGEPRAHVAPNKTRLSLVKNENNEIILTREFGSAICDLIKQLKMITFHYHLLII